VKFFAIIYDLRQPERNYNGLYDAIKELAEDGNWQHPMESFWVVSISDFSNKTVESMYEFLRQHIDDKDSLFISRIDSTEHQGWMPKNFWNWFKEKREKL
jgi:hypothetical protein